MPLSPDEVRYLLVNDIARAVQALAELLPGYDRWDAARQWALIDIYFGMGEKQFREHVVLHQHLYLQDWIMASMYVEMTQWARDTDQARVACVANQLRDGDAGECYAYPE